MQSSGQNSQVFHPSASSTQNQNIQNLQQKMTHKFSVKIFDLVASCLPPDTQEPYLKLDFDRFKLFQTDKEKGGADTEGKFEWGFKAGFIYTTKALEKLNQKKLKLHCYDAKGNPGSENPLIGSAEIDLRTLACGPSALRLKLYDARNEPTGLIEFNCNMRMASAGFCVLFEELAVTMQGSAAPCKLSISTSLRADIAPVGAPFSLSGDWKQSQMSLHYDATLDDLVRNEILKIVVQDEFGNEQGTVEMPFREYFGQRSKLVRTPHNDRFLNNQKDGENGYLSCFGEYQCGVNTIFL